MSGAAARTGNFKEKGGRNTTKKRIWVLRKRKHKTK